MFILTQKKINLYLFSNFQCCNSKGKRVERLSLYPPAAGISLEKASEGDGFGYNDILNGDGWPRIWL